MRPEPPDTRFYAELADLNLAFLRLLVSSRSYRAAPVFGLDAAIVEQLARLNATQLQSVAETRCLLATLRGAAPRRVHEPHVAEARPEAADPRWIEAARVFSASLVTYAWQIVRSDPLRAALCLGALAPEFRQLGFRDAQLYSVSAPGQLEARFCEHQRLWPDLVRAARDGGEEALRLARLAVVQVALSDAPRRVMPAAAAACVRDAMTAAD
jgi:hypothetical protein